MKGIDSVASDGWFLTGVSVDNDVDNIAPKSTRNIRALCGFHIEILATAVRGI